MCDPPGSPHPRRNLGRHTAPASTAPRSRRARSSTCALDRTNASHAPPQPHGPTCPHHRPSPTSPRSTVPPRATCLSDVRHPTQPIAPHSVLKDNALHWLPRTRPVVKVCPAVAWVMVPEHTDRGSVLTANLFPSNNAPEGPHWDLGTPRSPRRRGDQIIALYSK